MGPVIWDSVCYTFLIRIIRNCGGVSDLITVDYIWGWGHWGWVDLIKLIRSWTGVSRLIKFDTKSLVGFSDIISLNESWGWGCDTHS